jgi:hypothetical protein
MRGVSNAIASEQVTYQLCRTSLDATEPIDDAGNALIDREKFGAWR